MSEQRVLMTQYCDDVRQEVGNKFSLMGCYTEELIVEKMPAVLQKLCAQVRASTPLDNLFTKFTLRARLNGDIIAELDIDPTQFPSPEDKKDAKRLTIMAFMVFSPLVITEACKLEIEAETEDGTIKANALSIRVRTEGESIPWQ